MPIVVNLDVMMARRHKGAGELAEEIGITPANLSILKNNKAKAVRFSTLEGAGLPAGRAAGVRGRGTMMPFMQGRMLASARGSMRSSTPTKCMAQE